MEIIIKDARIYSDIERVEHIKRLIKKLSLETTIKAMLLFGISTLIIFYGKDKYSIFRETILSYIIPILIIGGICMFIQSVYLLLSGKYTKLNKNVLESEDIVTAYIDLLNKGDFTSLKYNYEDETARPISIRKLISFGFERYNYFVIPFASNENLDSILKDEVFDMKFYRQRISREKYYELLELHKDDIDKYREEISKYDFFEWTKSDTSTY